MTRWTPQIGRYEAPAEPQEPKVNNRAILNPLPKGTKVRVTHGENSLVGVVGHTSQDYGQTFWIEVGLGQSWRPVTFAIDTEQGWNVEILEVAP